MSIETRLHEEIEDELTQLGKIEVGTEPYKTTVDGVVKLYDKAIELKKLNLEMQDRDEAREMERNLKLQQMEEDRKDRIVKNCISVAGIVVPIGVTIWGTLKSFQFEKDGTITTIMGRGFINKLLPKK